MRHFTILNLICPKDSLTALIPVGLLVSFRFRISSIPSPHVTHAVSAKSFSHLFRPTLPDVIHCLLQIMSGDQESHGQTLMSVHFGLVHPTRVSFSYIPAILMPAFHFYPLKILMKQNNHHGGKNFCTHLYA